MTDINIKPIQIDVFGASDGEALVYSASNNTLEYRVVAGSEANLYNTYTTLTANIYNTYNSLSANVDSVNSNVDNVTANLYNTYIALNANLDVVSSNAAALDNNAFVNANDYNTYTTLKSQIDLVNANTSTLGNVYSDKFEIDGSTNAFTLSNTISSEESLLVYIDGVLQHSDAYVIDGLTLTLSNTLPLPVSTLGVRSLSALATTSGGSGGVSYLKTFALG